MSAWSWAVLASVGLSAAGQLALVMANDRSPRNLALTAVDGIVNCALFSWGVGVALNGC